MIPPNTAVSHLFAGMLKRVFVVALRAKEASSAHTYPRTADKKNESTHRVTHGTRRTHPRDTHNIAVE